MPTRPNSSSAALGVERFLCQRLGAGAFLRERVRTRITQAMGPCTRNDTDHATILILGERLAKFLTEKEVRRSLHPELQAELEFGIDNSKDQCESGFLDLIDMFQTEERDAAEQHLQPPTSVPNFFDLSARQSRR